MRIKYGTLLEALYFTLSMTASKNNLKSYIRNSIRDTLSNLIWNSIRRSSIIAVTYPDWDSIDNSIRLSVDNVVGTTVLYPVFCKTHDYFK